tara:strand:- start:2418 stop:3080 length:663 start_codon:yes stop_codon:yes gene_type:complete
MTQVRLHGILAREFGDKFKFNSLRAKDIIRAIDANRKNFANRVVNLAKQGFEYCIVVDNKKISDFTELELAKNAKFIDLVPVIAGSGFLLPILAAGATTFLGATLAGLGSAALGLAALSMVSMGLQMALAPKPEDPEPISATTNALRQSFLFSNKVNVAAQGTPVPVGFGRLKVGSQVIQFCLKSFPQSESSIAAMTANPFNVVADRINDSDSSIITNRL